jgi:hypothetical protein
VCDVPTPQVGQNNIALLPELQLQLPKHINAVRITVEVEQMSQIKHTTVSTRDQHMTVRQYCIDAHTVDITVGQCCIGAAKAKNWDEKH